MKKKSIKILWLLLFLCLTLKDGNGVNASSIEQKDHKRYFKLELTQDLVLDMNWLKQDKKFYTFIFLDIIVDSNENILVLTNNSILKFDKGGKLLYTFQLELGEGPGECRSFPIKVFIDPGDNIYLDDGYKIIKFDKTFKFIKNIKLVIDSDLCIDRQGSLYTFTREYLKKNSRLVLCKFDDSGKFLKSITPFIDMDSYFFGGLVVILKHNYSPALYFSLTTDLLVVGSNWNYKLSCYNLEDGRFLSSVTVDERPQEISSREKEITREKYKDKISANFDIEFRINFPDHRPFFKGILADEKNRLYIIRTKSVLEKGTDETMDVLRTDGQYLFKTKLQYEPKIIKNGKIYFMVQSLGEDENYLYEVRRFKINNYEYLPR